MEAGLALAELIASISKPSATLVLGGGHSIGIPLAVSAQRSFIVPTATMTVHPVRHSGLIVGVPQTMHCFEQMQQRITGFVAAHSGMTEKRYTELMLHTGELVMDMGTVLDGRRAVKEKLIDELGGLSDALDWLHRAGSKPRITQQHYGLPFLPLAWYNNRIKNCVYANCGEQRKWQKKRKTTAKRRVCTQKKPGTAAAGGAGHPVCGAAAHGAGVRGGRLRLESAAPGAVRAVRLRQLCAGRSGVLSGRPVHPGRGPADAVFKLLLGLIFASGTVIVFSDIPADLTAAQMIAACYQNGANAWLGGGVLGTLLGGNLLLLCGRPAANLVMAVLALCASLYIFDLTPAECWQWLCNVGGGVHEKGVAV